MATVAPSAATLSTDGRVRRAARSRAAIEDALFTLVGEGIVQPTVQDVAQRAGVAMRSVFRHFSDMESLFAEMHARLQAEAVPLLLGGRPNGTLTERARALVRQRGAFFGRIAPYKRSGNLKRWRSPFLRDRHALLVRELRADLLRWLPELRRAPAAIVDALDLTTSFEAWDRLRSEQHLGTARAQAVVERTVLALVKELRS